MLLELGLVIEEKTFRTRLARHLEGPNKQNK